MDSATGQRTKGRFGRHVVLVGQFRLQQGSLGWCQKRQDDGGSLVPPGQAAQVGLAQRKVAPGQVHTRQHRADAFAVQGGGG